MIHTANRTFFELPKIARLSFRGQVQLAGIKWEDKNRELLGTGVDMDRIVMFEASPELRAIKKTAAAPISKRRMSAIRPRRQGVLFGDECSVMESRFCMIDCGRNGKVKRPAY